MNNILKKIAEEVNNIPDVIIKGKVSGIKGLIISVRGLRKFASIGSRCEIFSSGGKITSAEVVAINAQEILLMPFDDVTGISANDDVALKAAEQSVYPSLEWLGRVVNAFGEPIDGKGALKKGTTPYFLKRSPPPSQSRTRVGEKMNVGIRAINTFLSLCRGQRMGVFAGSGVGKSMMIAMLAKYAETDVKVIGLIGERGREVQEFIEDYLGEEGLARSIVVVATSDESVLLRRQAANLTLSLCEYFSDQGKEVLCMMDSVTRYAMALREIGLSVGEPPTAKGYTPGVFAELPRLLERAGPMLKGRGAITALFSVLVEGDDHNEPVADAVRGIIDGHIVLDRNIAARRYPAIDILKSVSRMIPKCNNEYENKLISKSRGLISTFEEMADMIRIGAYKKGSDPLVDEAIKYREGLENFLNQAYNEHDDLESSYLKLAGAIDFKPNA
ncbi:flagellum-specific ATP synthase [endosymbiont of Acanthamoeba sp. UWC8]|uniref:flagellar protein export ATPase FliI n=1 Tax=endosymbiont of Acanthamoeba sp. UWC8 TaxID=86106 RepID=UPI0004D17674|nr:flagellar protein export ATPase FliI [endosymbiont of Acanthamoeba sp. UWC8]AIF81840.1 flagellum-specific ATP synthase [endosymbiont of Acanthamoeba sp. UWC8]